MSKKSNPQFTEGMVRFGRYLKLLRCPAYHDFKVKILEYLCQQGLCEPFDRDDVESVDRCFNKVADEDLPSTFRAVQLLSKRYKLRIIPLREAAEELGISKNTLNDYEQGKRYPPIEFIYKYSLTMSYPVEPLLHQWLKNHDNEFIQEHAEMRLEDHYFHDLSTSAHDEKRNNARAFFEKAITIALSRGGVIGLGNETKRNIAIAFSDIVDEVMAQGLELAPDNITMKILNQTYRNIK